MSFYYLTKKLAEIYHPEVCEEVTRFVPGVPSGGGTGGGDEHCYEVTVQAVVPIHDDNNGGLEIGGTGDIVGAVTIDDVITVCTVEGIPDNAIPADGGYNVTEEVCVPEHTTLEPSVGWDATAHSISTFINDAKYEFKADDNVSGIITGFSNQAVTEYEHIRWGFFLTGGRFRIVEFGQYQTGSWSYTSADVFRIERIAGVVRYYQDDTLRYTSTDIDNGPMVGNAVMYVSSERLNDAAFTQHPQLGATAIEIEPPTMYADDIDVTTGTDNHAHIDAQPGVVDGQSFTLGDATMDAEPAEINASNNSVYAYAEMLAGVAESEGGNIPLIPAYSVGNVVTGEADATGYGVITVGGGGAMDAGGAEMLATNYAYAEGDMSAGGAEAQGWKVAGLIGTAIVKLPAFSVSAIGIDSRGTFSAKLPAFRVAGHSGGDGRIKLPAFSLSAAGVNNGIGIGTIKLPAFSVAAEGVNRGWGVGTIRLPSFKLSAFGSGSATVKIPAFKVTAAGTVRFVATGHLKFPAFKVSATAQYHRVATGTLRFPAFSVASQIIGTLRFPAFKVSGIGGETTTQQYAYVINSGNKAVTRWTHAPFKESMRLGNRYFVLIGTTVYELVGDKQYDGSDINMELLTFSSDLGISELKSVPKAYFNLRSFSGLEISPIVDEIENDPSYTASSADSIKNQPVKFGRGLQGRHWGFRIKNQCGEDIYLNSGELRTLVKTRRHNA